MKAYFFIFCITYLIKQAYTLCHFGQDLQGIYLTQSIVSRGSDVDYLEVAVLPDSIPVWGHCRRRFGNNVILYDMAGAVQCLKCFHISSRSAHILEVHTNSLSTCYTNEGAALTRCPTPHLIREGKTREIMLYKTNNLMGGLPPPPVYCPLNGRFLATYNINDGTEITVECPEHRTEVRNCPVGNQLTIGFKRCTFKDFSKTFDCLGSWPGYDGQHYLALRDPTVEAGARATGAVGSHRGRPGLVPPKYRCALYREDTATGRIHLSLSSDSTCFNNLNSAEQGYESLVLERQTDGPIPRLAISTQCEFPPWMQGQWEDIKVSEGRALLTDLSLLKTFDIYCTGMHRGVGNALMPVYATTQCGDRGYTCVEMAERSSNVMEFRMGPLSDVPIDSCLSLPDPNTPWITQGRVDRFRRSPCPVSGEFTGVIPDAPTLCAKLYSDCNNPEVMFYTVAMCSNRTQIVEEREYRCLGQWSEGEITFTYTERRDLQSSYECFAGTVSYDEEIYIAEAGTRCGRGLDPTVTGMRLDKQATCQNEVSFHIPPISSYPTLEDNSIRKNPRLRNPAAGAGFSLHQPILKLISLALISIFLFRR